MQSITTFAGTLEARAKAWSRLSDGDLKRKAAKAVEARDTTALWSLTEAYIVTKGQAGAEVSRHTLDNYERGTRFLLDAWSGESILRPSRDAGDRYVRRLQAEGKKAGTIAVRIAAGKALYKALRWAGVTKEHPFADVRPPVNRTKAEDRMRIYTQEHVVKMLMAANLVDRAIVQLGSLAALRVSEMLSLHWSDIDLEARKADVVGKGRKEATVHLHHDLVDTLRELKADTGGEGYVLPFRTPQRARARLKRLCRDAGVPYRGVHALRHYCATRLYALTHDIYKAQDHLRHSNIHTTTVYARNDHVATHQAVDAL